MSVCEDEGWDTAQDSEEEQQLAEVSFNIGLNPINFLSQSYPLEPDMLFGWRPKLPLSPIPLTYTNLYVDWLLNYIHTDQNGYKLVYVGNRLTNSVKVNKQYDYMWKQRQKYNLNVQVLQETIEFMGKNSLRRVINAADEQYLFNSNFESGNLDAAIRVKSDEYDCFLRSDSNTRGHCNWYYFSIKSKQQSTVKLNICNLNKRTELYAKGMKPYINDGSGWKQAGQNVQFVQRYCRYGFDIKHYQIQFSLTFTKPNQEILVAYGIPYTYTQLEQFIEEIKVKHSSKVTVESLCDSLGGVSLPVITITDKTVNQPTKRTVLMTARLHPGQSVSSHMIQGLVRALLTDDRYSQLLKNFECRIVPMINPDGVILGNFRTSYSGKDLNRQFLSLDKRVFPEVEALNQFVKNLKEHYKGKFAYYFDLHGHSTKSNLFCYGPEHSKTSPYYLRSRAFAKLIEQSDPLFSYRRSIFSISDHKRATSRANMFLKHRIPMSYTFQLSNGLYENSNKSYSNLDTKDMHRAGRLIIESFHKFIGMNAPLVYHTNPILKSRYLIRQSKLKLELKPELLLKQSKPSKKPRKGNMVLKRINEQPSNLRQRNSIRLTENVEHQRQSNKQMEQLLNRVKQQKSDLVEQGGSDSEDEIEDLNVQELAKLHHHIFNREIKYDTTQSKETETRVVPHPLRPINKQNQQFRKTLIEQTLPQVKQRKIISRSITARIRKRETINQQKYLLAQKHFIMNL